MTYQQGQISLLGKNGLIEAKLNKLLYILNATLAKTIPKKNCKRKFKYPPWWDEKLTILRSKCRKLAKNKTPAGRDLYTSLRREYKNDIVTAKREGWIKFTSEIKHPSDVSKLIKSFNNCKNNALGLLKKNSDGDYCDNPTESLNILLGKFFPGHAALSETDIRSRDDAGMDWIVVKNNRLDKTFTIKKVKAAFAHMGSYKSAGPYGFKPIVMKHFGPRALGCITNIFKQFTQQGTSLLSFVNQKWSSFRSH